MQTRLYCSVPTPFVQTRLYCFVQTPFVQTPFVQTRLYCFVQTHLCKPACTVLCHTPPPGKDRVEIMLALGATRMEAARSVLQRSLLVALTPVLNQLSVVGIVSIPGMMTGQILVRNVCPSNWCADPVDRAVRIRQTPLGTRS